MTLGGLALAVGILVDNSTVTIENTHRLLTEENKPLPYATLHGAAGIAVPTLVSTLAICCVFTSVVFLDGPAKYLFTPLGLAVVFAMLASYGLSRTLTPITIGLLLKGEHHGDRTPPKGWFGRLTPGSNRLRAHAAQLYRDAASLLARKLVVPVVAAAILALGGVMFTLVGRDFFPLIDGGQIQLHVRAPGRDPHRGDRGDVPGRSRTRSARSSRTASASASSTISVCRRAPIISLSPTARPSASMTASSSWR